MTVSEIIKSNLRDYLNSEYFRKVCKKHYNKKLKIIKKLPEFFNTNYYDILTIKFNIAKFRFHKLDYSDTVSAYHDCSMWRLKTFFGQIPRKAFSSYILTISARGDDCQVAMDISFSYRELQLLRFYLFCASSEIKKNYDYTENEISNYYS